MAPQISPPNFRSGVLKDAADIAGMTRKPQTPLPPAEPPAGPRRSCKIKFPISYLDNITIIQTPEPATLCLLALGGLAMIRRRRK